MSQPPAALHLRHGTTASLLRRSFASLLFSPSLLLASFLLLFFRSALLAGTLRLSSLPDRDPAIRSLLHRLSFSPSSSASSTHPAPPPPSSPPPHTARRRPPFLHLTRLGTLDDDGPFSDPSSSSRLGSLGLNASFPALFLLGDGTVGQRSSTNPSLKFRVPEFVPSSPFVFSFPDMDDLVGLDVDRDRFPDLRILGRGFDLDPRDATAIVYLLTLLSATHALAIIGFLLTYTSALGIVFFTIVTSQLGKPVSVINTICSGAQLGMRRLTGFVFLRWAARDALIQFLCIWFFADVRDQNVLFKLFVKVKLMPFSLSPVNPWPGPYDEALSGFFFVWALVDTAVSLVFAVVPSVVIMDHDFRRRGKDVLKEGFFLTSLMPRQAIWIKLLETLVCACMGRWMATVFGWKLFVTAFLSIAEIYFMVVWMVFYFSARCKDGELIAFCAVMQIELLLMIQSNGTKPTHGLLFALAALV
ncbi:hypothetical protein ZIOFF_033776 [Zingiber officinale]|uniref:Uncharacterized protein n=1 Tax=Zingiber officinale TaxID=94328 RepID=A0A8J5LCR9_ZINOF|nr:hypothetical protein ZIOFF_033776 [Zingiber officinale]